MTIDIALVEVGRKSKVSAMCTCSKISSLSSKNGGSKDTLDPPFFPKGVVNPLIPPCIRAGVSKMYSNEVFSIFHVKHLLLSFLQ